MEMRVEPHEGVLRGSSSSSSCGGGSGGDGDAPHQRPPPPVASSALMPPPPPPPPPPVLGRDALDAVFAALAGDREACKHVRQVSREWRAAFQSCHAPLPPLKLSPPLDEGWITRHARRLRALQLSGVDDLRTCTTALAELRALTSLSLDSCRRLTSLAPLAPPLFGGTLRRLSLRNCRALADLAPLGAAHLPALDTLVIDRCGSARDLTPLRGHPGLSQLHLGYDVYSAVALQLPAALPALRKLRVMAAVQDLTPLGAYVGLTSLEVFAVSVCSLGPLRHLTNLVELDLHQLQDDLLLLRHGVGGGGNGGGNGVEEGIEEWEQDHHSMSPRNPFLPLARLQSLGLTGSDDGVVDELVPWRALPPSLTRVDLHGSGVRDASLAALCDGLRGSLVSLDLAQTRHVRDLSPLRRCARLAEVNLIGAAATDLRPVLHLLASGGLRRGKVSSAAT